MEPVGSNIAVQRTVNDHTSYMTKVIAKCEIDGEIFGDWSANAWETLKLLHNTWTWGIIRDRQGYHHLTPTPQPGAPSYPKVPMHPSTTPVYKKTTHIPPGL